METPLLPPWAQMVHQALPTTLKLVLSESTRTAGLPLDTASTFTRMVLENAFFLSHELPGKVKQGASDQ